MTLEVRSRREDRPYVESNSQTVKGAELFCCRRVGDRLLQEHGSVVLLSAVALMALR